MNPQRTGRCLCFSRLGFGKWRRVVHKEAERVQLGYQLAQQRELLPNEHRRAGGRAGDVAAWTLDTGDEAEFHRVAAARENDWNNRGRSLGRECRSSTSERDQNSYVTTNQFIRKCRQSIVMPLGPAVFDRHISTFDVTTVP